jgi:hypothetical protein
MRNGLAIGLLVAAALACGCGEKKPGMTPEELVSVLRTAGIRYDVCESTALASISAPGLRMRGDSLDVEIYQVVDEEDLARAEQIARQAAAALASSAGRTTMRSYVHDDLLIIVRQEPEPGMVGRALPAPRD